MMKYKLCLMAGTMGLAVISGIFEALSAPRANTKEAKQETEEPGMAEAAEKPA